MLYPYSLAIVSQPTVVNLANHPVVHLPCLEIMLKELDWRTSCSVLISG
jgi:hypothetical protein